MPPIDDYRNNAELARQAAANARNDADRERALQVEKAWRIMTARAELQREGGTAADVPPSEAALRETASAMRGSRDANQAMRLSASIIASASEPPQAA